MTLDLCHRYRHSPKRIGDTAAVAPSSLPGSSTTR